MPTGHPGPTPRRPPHHTHPPHQLCDCVCQCACALACLPAVAQLCLNATAECQSSRVVPVTHTAGWRYCVGAVSTLSATVATSCLCIPRTQKHTEVSPRPAPAPPHQPARLSVLLSAHCCISLSTLCPALINCKLPTEECVTATSQKKGGLLSRSVVSDTLKYTDWTPSQLIRICPRDSLLQVWLRNSLLRDVKAFTPSRCG